MFCRSGVRGHDDDRVSEVDRASAVVGKLAVVHDLQQDVGHVRMRLFDLVEKEHGVRILVHAVGQQAALIESYVSGRGADQPRNRMLLHVFGHVEPEQLHPHCFGELLRCLSFSDSRRSREQVGSDWLFGFSESGAAEFDG